MKPSLQDQIAEVRREIAMRQRVYVRQIDKGKMTVSDAEVRTTRLVAVLRTLEWVRDKGLGGPVDAG